MKTDVLITDVTQSAFIFNQLAKIEPCQGSCSYLDNPGCDPELLIVKPLRGLVGNIQTIKKLKAFN